jgi:hypothetical protein
VENSVLSEALPFAGRHALSPMKWADIYDLISPTAFNASQLLDMREQFSRTGYVKLTGFLPSKALEIFKEEMDEMEQAAIRRQFQMPGYATPRSLSVLGGNQIRSQSPLLYSLYHHYALRSCIESIVGRTVFSCTHPEEYMVANFLHNSGDTHGWHLDDPAFALIIFADAPSEGGGGEIEYISNWKDLCRRKGRKPDEDIQDLVEWADKNGMVDRQSHRPGDAYLLRADHNLHRVTPLLRPGERRAAVNMAYQSAPDTLYGQTANLLYGY